MSAYTRAKFGLIGIQVCSKLRIQVTIGDAFLATSVHLSLSKAVLDFCYWGKVAGTTP